MPTAAYRNGNPVVRPEAPPCLPARRGQETLPGPNPPLAPIIRGTAFRLKKGNVKSLQAFGESPDDGLGALVQPKCRRTEGDSCVRRICTKDDSTGLIRRVSSRIGRERSLINGSGPKVRLALWFDQNKRESRKKQRVGCFKILNLDFKQIIRIWVSVPCGTRCETLETRRRRLECFGTKLGESIQTKQWCFFRKARVPRTRQGPGRAAQQPQCPARTSHPSQEGSLKALDRARGTGQHRNGLAPEYRLPRPGGHKAHADADADANDADNASPKKPQRNRRIERADKDASFLDSFVPHKDWLPPDTVATDYTPEFCAKLKRVFWRNCGLARPAWHDAVTMGSLFTPATTAWNVATLPSMLSRLLPPSSGGLPGVNTPYLYFGMWCATFAWHVEDMDLFSINYIHFGAPKFWYAVPQGRAGALEGRMRGYFPADTSTCPQFLRHKSFLASPSLLSQSAVRPNHLVQHAGEFVVTFPRGYHAGFNLGLNCAESVNFALDSWLDEGRKAGVCGRVDFSVRIDVDQLLEDRRIDALELTDPAAAAHARAVRDGLIPDGDLEGDGAAVLDVEMPAVDTPAPSATSKGKQKATSTKTLTPSTGTAKPRQTPCKRKPTAPFEPEDPAPKRVRTMASIACSSAHQQHAHASTSTAGAYVPSSHQPAPPKITLKIAPRSPPPTLTPPAPLRTTANPPLRTTTNPTRTRPRPDLPLLPLRRALAYGAAARTRPARGVARDRRRDGGGKGVWMAHEGCAMVLPETWVDEVVVSGHGGERRTERVVFGVDGIERARWNLKRSTCTTQRAKAHGALIQCVKGKCPKAFHINCARAGAEEGTGIAYTVVREVEKEVVLLEPAPPSAHAGGAELNLRVLKVIHKTEVEALCAQHNPVFVASRRASKTESLRADVLTLPPLSRIKIRVFSGVFEVTLMHVLEDRRAVEVLWDAGEVREVKWTNIVLGLGVGQIEYECECGGGWTTCDCALSPVPFACVSAVRCPRPGIRVAVPVAAAERPPIVVLGAAAALLSYDPPSRACTTAAGSPISASTTAAAGSVRAWASAVVRQAARWGCPLAVSWPMREWTPMCTCYVLVLCY
ncbi:JmjC domain, hydroxylase-domain-containing protein [Mycena metata]|uniref:JmjC domain, hydroxylase-domain-containing protein n=1 Tax=Mycena metata TaxID=1033252 RepID=A0AAD7N390_9AGAR|nr:JmjC domain, hydroxylase-domain-containing protein [Mycena metata]